jgi:NAD-reducing hydrogenase large subunit
MTTDSGQPSADQSSAGQTSAGQIRRIVIDPVTRIEGHAKITLQLDPSGEVSDAWFHVTQFRGFEKLAEGRPFQEMPALMARTCGICPVSHLIAASKACDALLAVEVPQTAVKLRRVLNLAQLLQSHALSFFHLSSPDLLLGMDSDPGKRHLIGVLETNPQMARDGIALRKFGQQIIEWLGGKRIHPAWVVPGGVNAPLSLETRDRILAGIPEAARAVQRTLEAFKPLLKNFKAEIESFANFPSLFLGLVGKNGELEHYDGQIRVKDGDGNTVLDGADPSGYLEFLDEQVEPWSYLKSPYYKPLGYPGGLYRVGPLARLNVASHCGTPRADTELAWFRSLEPGGVSSIVKSSFHYHVARLVEMVYALEKIEMLLTEPDILSDRVRAVAGVNRLEGVGVAEAPRGTLMHHYRVDANGLVTWVNMIIATGHNNLAMNRGVLQVAKRFVRNDHLEEGALNRVEAVIRAYDPCLSCSTHALGQMPLEVRLVASDGVVLETVSRD